MNVDLTPELEALVQDKIKSGRYNSVNEVVRQALQLLQQRDEILTRHRDEIGNQIEEGWQSAKLREFVDGDEVFDRIDAELEALERSASERFVLTRPAERDLDQTGCATSREF